MKIRNLIAVLIMLAAPALLVSARTPAKEAKLTIESHTEADGKVTMDGKKFCSLPNHKQCTSSVPPGTHDFKFVFQMKDDPTKHVYTITASGNFTSGQHRTMLVDTDGATWKD